MVDLKKGIELHDRALNDTIQYHAFANTVLSAWLIWAQENAGELIREVRAFRLELEREKEEAKEQLDENLELSGEVVELQTRLAIAQEEIRKIKGKTGTGWEREEIQKLDHFLFDELSWKFGPGETGVDVAIRIIRELMAEKSVLSERRPYTLHNCGECVSWQQYWEKKNLGTCDHKYGEVGPIHVVRHTTFACANFVKTYDPSNQRDFG